MRKSKVHEFAETLSEFADEGVKRFGGGALEGLQVSARAGVQLLGTAGVALLFGFGFIQADRYARSCLPAAENAMEDPAAPLISQELMPSAPGVEKAPDNPPRVLAPGPASNNFQGGGR